MLLYIPYLFVALCVVAVKARTSVRGSRNQKDRNSLHFQTRQGENPCKIPDYPDFLETRAQLQARDSLRRDTRAGEASLHFQTRQGENPCEIPDYPDLLETRAQLQARDNLKRDTRAGKRSLHFQDPHKKLPSKKAGCNNLLSDPIPPRGGGYRLCGRKGTKAGLHSFNVLAAATVGRNTVYCKSSHRLANT